MLNCPYCGEDKSILVQLPVFIHTTNEEFVTIPPERDTQVMCTECVELTKEALEENENEKEIELHGQRH